MTTAFKPVLYLKVGCPFSFKLRLFLLEAGLLDGFEIKTFVEGEPEEAAIRAELAPHLEKVTFPTVQIAPGQFMQDSDAVIAKIAGEHGIDPTRMPTYQFYLKGVFARVGLLYRENMELKKKLSA